MKFRLEIPEKFPEYREFEKYRWYFKLHEFYRFDNERLQVYIYCEIQ